MKNTVNLRTFLHQAEGNKDISGESRMFIAVLRGVIDDIQGNDLKLAAEARDYIRSTDCKEVCSLAGIGYHQFIELFRRSEMNREILR